MRITPKWAQAICTDNAHCSVCESVDVFFQKMDYWDENCNVFGAEFKCRNWAIKRYCKDCFFEYGGDGELVDIQESTNG